MLLAISAASKSTQCNLLGSTTYFLKLGEYSPDMGRSYETIIGLHRLSVGCSFKEYLRCIKESTVGEKVVNTPSA